MSYFNNIDTIEDEFDNIINSIFGPRNTFISNILFSLAYPEYEDMELNNALERSFNEQPVLNRTDSFINFNSEKYINMKNKNIENKNCSICISDFIDEDDVSLTKCNHLFHNNCLVEWTHYKQSCPTCRFDFKEKKD